MSFRRQARRPKTKSLQALIAQAQRNNKVGQKSRVRVRSQQLGTRLSVGRGSSKIDRATVQRKQNGHWRRVKDWKARYEFGSVVGYLHKQGRKHRHPGQPMCSGCKTNKDVTRMFNCDFCQRNWEPTCIDVDRYGFKLPQMTQTGHRVKEWACPCCAYEAVEANRLNPIRKAKISSSSSAVRALEQAIAVPQTLRKRKTAGIPFTENGNSGSHRTGLDYFNESNSDDSDEDRSIRASKTPRRNSIRDSSSDSASSDIDGELGQRSSDATYEV